MSTLKTHNLQSPDAGSVNIALTSNAGMIVTGISTFSNDVLITDKIIHTGDTNTAIRFPSADTFSVETAGSERLRIDSGGRLLINRTSTYASSSEKLSVNGMTSIQGSSTSAANLYIFNTDTTGSGTVQPYIFLHDGSGIRGGLGLQYSTANLVINGQSDIQFRTGSSGVGGSEKLRIDSSGKIITPLGTTTRIGVADRTSGTGAGGSLCVTAGAARGSGQTTGDLILASGRGNNSASAGTIRFGYNNGVNGTNLDQEWLRIASNGRVNIGNRTTTPDELVHIHTASGEANVHVEAATNANLNLRSHSGDSTIKFSDASATNVGNINYDHATDSLSFRTNSNERARIDSSGRVLIGTTTEGFATYGDKFTIANSGHCGMTIRSGTSSDGNIYFSDGTSGVDEVRGFVEYKHSTNTLQLGANGATRLRITSSGHVTKPVQPSFAAYRAQSQWNVSNGSVMVFNQTRHNTGTHYNTGDGRFTAPVAGSYQFNFYSIYIYSYNDAYTRLRVNGSRIYGGDCHFSTSQGNNWHNLSWSQVLYLNANEYVDIVSYTGTGSGSVGWHGNHWQCWSGWLLG